MALESAMIGFVSGLSSAISVILYLLYAMKDLKRCINDVKVLQMFQETQHEDLVAKHAADIKRLSGRLYKMSKRQDNFGLAITEVWQQQGLDVNRAMSLQGKKGQDSPRRQPR